MRQWHARLSVSAPLMVSALALTGCMGSPTYGTGTPAHEQLLSDVTGVLSIAPNKDKPKIDYKPRPDLVRPAPGEKESLPAPQQSITAGNQAWPESPEQRRQRVFTEATAAAEEGRESPVQSDMASTGGGVTSKARYGERGNFEVEPDPTGSGVRTGRTNQGVTSRAKYERGNFNNEGDVSNGKEREEFNKRLAETRQGSPTTRKYLSEPPLTYRQPADTAPVNDVGEDEWKKDRRQKKESKKGSSWTDWIPGL